jgi:hypothetical protein
MRRLHEFTSKKVYEFIGGLADYYDLIEPNHADMFESTGYLYKEQQS